MRQTCLRCTRLDVAALLGLAGVLFNQAGCSSPSTSASPQQDAAPIPRTDAAQIFADAPAKDVGSPDLPAVPDVPQPQPDLDTNADVNPLDLVVEAPGRTTCVPQYTSCTGLCGSVLDLCTGETLSCGGCAAGLACDVSSHACITPKATCADLGAECGRIRNTCGTVLDCGACADGKECNPDTNRCIACTLPAGTSSDCLAMGIACGKAWLGCGATTNLTDCGGCPSGQVCNPSFNVCEPLPVVSGGACVVLTKAQACADRGNQCGFVTDGCGGIVNCGDCAMGQECGTVGVANRCNKAQNTTCADQGRVCGSAVDLCGLSVSCGSCPAGQTCNPRGTCDAVDAGCQAKACADLPGICGWKVPDGCGGSLNCYDCWVNNQVCGPLTDGVGQCCSAPTALPTGWECGTVTNACGSKDFACPSGKACGSDHKCCTLPDKSALPSGAVCGTVTNTCGSQEITCNDPTKACKNGQCCVLPTAPTDGSCGTLTNSCGSKDFWCSNGQSCVNGKCANTCWSTYSGKCGSKLPDGAGGTLDCPCSGTGNVCSASASGVTGTCSCATQKTCTDYSGRCGTLDAGCGGTVTCGCSKAYETCGGGGTAGVCGCTKATCAGKCGIIDDKCGGTLSCGAC